MTLQGSFRRSATDEDGEGDQQKPGIFLAVGNEAIKFNIVDGSAAAGSVRGWLRRQEDTERVCAAEEAV